MESLKRKALPLSYWPVWKVKCKVSFPLFAVSDHLCFQVLRHWLATWGLFCGKGIPHAIRSYSDNPTLNAISYCLYSESSREALLSAASCTALSLHSCRVHKKNRIIKSVFAPLASHCQILLVVFLLRIVTRAERKLSRTFTGPGRQNNYPLKMSAS